jgi:lactobin A/cerein 7B family class IIb bacteriocin
MLNDTIGICALTDDELGEVSGGVGLLAAAIILTVALAGGLVVGTYLKHQDQAASGGNKPGDYPTQPTSAAA